MLENWSVNFYIYFGGRPTSLLFLGPPQSRGVYDRRKEKLNTVLATPAAVNYVAQRHHVKNNPKLSSTTSDRR